MKLRVKKHGSPQQGTVDAYVVSGSDVKAVVVWDAYGALPQPARISIEYTTTLIPVGWFTRSVQHIGAPPDA